MIGKICVKVWILITTKLVGYPSYMSEKHFEKNCLKYMDKDARHTMQSLREECG